MARANREKTLQRIVRDFNLMTQSRNSGHGDLPPGAPGVHTHDCLGVKERYLRAAASRSFACSIQGQKGAGGESAGDCTDYVNAALMVVHKGRHPFTIRVSQNANSVYHVRAGIEHKATS